jgi:hypothetical protein
MGGEQVHVARAALPAFLDGVLRQLRDLIARGRAGGALTVPGARKCPAPGCGGYLRRRSGSRGEFWSGTRYPECNHTGMPSPRPPPGQSAPRETAHLGNNRPAEPLGAV